MPGAEVVGVASLAEVAARYGNEKARPTSSDVVRPVARARPEVADLDLADVRGQEEARWALEVAAAGGHHMLMVGPPGAGKSMLAARLPGILPDLGPDDAVVATSVHSIAGTLDAGAGLLVRPPFEAPHHSASAAAIVGGGSHLARPGAISRAHAGVLFLDEAPEFPASVLQTLRQPLESGEVVLHRAAGAARYPARFQLVLAANPCPCGQLHGDGGGVLVHPDGAPPLLRATLRPAPRPRGPPYRGPSRAPGHGRRGRGERRRSRLASRTARERRPRTARREPDGGSTGRCRERGSARGRPARRSPSGCEHSTGACSRRAVSTDRFASPGRSPTSTVPDRPALAREPGARAAVARRAGRFRERRSGRQSASGAGRRTSTRRLGRSSRGA